MTEAPAEPAGGEPPAAADEPDRLCVIIAADSDAGRLMERLVEQGISVTRIGSTGGFLRRGNATLICGVGSDAVEEVIETVRDECHARREFVPVQSLPFLGDGGFNTAPVEVRIGGAIVFVLVVERFVRA